MTSLADLVFLAGVAGLLVHELDAVYRGEWRFFFGRTPLSDVTAYRLYVALHAPLLVLLLWGLPWATFRLVLDGFLLAHAGLHALLSGHPALHFDGWFSRAWIYGAAATGALHLVLVVPR